MGFGALAFVEEWSEAVERRDGDRLARLSAEDVEVVGPRGSVRGRQALGDWLARAGFAATPRRWFCGVGGSVVLEQDARWLEVRTGAELGRAVVASRSCVVGGVVAGYQRYDHLAEDLVAAGLEEGRDEVLEHLPPLSPHRRPRRAGTVDRRGVSG